MKQTYMLTNIKKRNIKKAKICNSLGLQQKNLLTKPMTESMINFSCGTHFQTSFPKPM